MVNSSWLDDVQKRLAKHALPSSYVQRFIAELSDHLVDLKEEGMDQNSSSRLGKPEQVADTAATAYRRRSFLGRHPLAKFLVFGISPIMSLVALVALVIGVLVILPEGWDRPMFAALDQFGPSASVLEAYLGSVLVVVIPSILVSILYCWLAGRSGTGKKWMLLSCVMLAVLAALPVCTARVSSVWADCWMRIGLWRPDGIGHFYSFFSWTFCRPQQFMQFLVPLTVGLWFTWHRRGLDQLQPAS